MVEYNFCRIATLSGSEEGCICLRDGVVYAIFVRLAGDTAHEQGWFLYHGFGPCDEEGVIFRSIDEAGEWIECRISAKREQ